MNDLAVEVAAPAEEEAETPPAAEEPAATDNLNQSPILTGLWLELEVGLKTC